MTVFPTCLTELKLLCSSIQTSGCMQPWCSSEFWACISCLTMKPLGWDPSLEDNTFQGACRSSALFQNRKGAQLTACPFSALPVVQRDYGATLNKLRLGLLSWPLQTSRKLKWWQQIRLFAFEAYWLVLWTFFPQRASHSEVQLAQAIVLSGAMERTWLQEGRSGVTSRLSRVTCPRMGSA